LPLRLLAFGLALGQLCLVAGCPQKPAPSTQFAAPAGTPEAQAQAVDPFVHSDDDARSLTEDGLIRLAETSDIPFFTGAEYRLGKHKCYMYRGYELDNTEFFKLFDRSCPHDGCNVEFAAVRQEGRLGTYEFRCPCCASRFNDHGLRIAGPALRGLTKYKLRFDDVVGSSPTDPNPPKIIVVDMSQTEQ
jgi:Rieske Fe-S protein